MFIERALHTIEAALCAMAGKSGGEPGKGWELLQRGVVVNEAIGASASPREVEGLLTRLRARFPCVEFIQKTPSQTPGWVILFHVFFTSSACFSGAKMRFFFFRVLNFTLCGDFRWNRQAGSLNLILEMLEASGCGYWLHWEVYL